MKGVVIVFAALLAVTVGVDFKDCGSTEVKFLAVDVPGCDGAAVCPLKKGSNVSLSINFTANTAFTDLTNHAYGNLHGIKVPFPGFPENDVDVCKQDGVKCPIAEKSNVVEKLILPISGSFPDIEIEADWKLEDSKGTVVGCFAIVLKLS